MSFLSIARHLIGFPLIMVGGFIGFVGALVAFVGMGITFGWSEAIDEFETW